MLAAILFAAVLETGAPSSGLAAFDQLKSLAGEWRDEANADRPMTVAYRVISGGSAVVETWTTASGRETMTLYVMDGAQLIATHYCAQGNQPTLVLDASADELRFSMRSVTGLDADEAHQHGFSIQPVNADRMLHTETYVHGAESETTSYDLVRLR